MELTEDYDADPFVDELLFVVTEDTDGLPLHISYALDGETSALEIADNGTGDVLWSDRWTGEMEPATASIALEGLKADYEHVISFTGTGVRQAKIAVTSESELVQERARPLDAENG